MAAVGDPLDETYVATRPPLEPIPWNKEELTAVGREAVAQALLAGYPRNQIARALGTSVKTLKRLIDVDPALSDTIDARRDAEEAELRDILMSMARKGDTVAAIFLGKSQFGWRDRDDGKLKVEQSGGGVLVLPAAVPLDEWCASAARQQAPHRERPVEDREVRDSRSRTELGNGLVMQRLLPGDLSD